MPEPNWTGTFTITLELTDSEKKCLEAIAQLGSFTPSDDDYPAEIDRLEEHEFIVRERQGETYTRGGRARGGVDVLRLTETGRLWLADCRRTPDGA